MKKMLTKMLAVAMAWAMLLSCTVMASASGSGFTPGANATGETPQSGIGGEGQLKYGWGVTGTDSSGLQVASTGYRNYASGEAKGVSHNEGKVPADVIRLVMPTVKKNALDMILDPHNLINKTKAARYGSTGVKFSDDTQVYFVNAISDGVVYYTNESQDLTITNKSSVPVNVNLRLRANRGSGIESSGFKFVSTSSGLLSSTGATMYLALVSGTKEVPVVESEGEWATWDDDDVRYYPVKTSGGSASTLIGKIGSDALLSSGVFQLLNSSAASRLTDAAAGFPTIVVEVIKAASDGSASWFESYPGSNGDYPHTQGISVYSTGQIVKITAGDWDNYEAVIEPDYLTSYNPTDKNIGYVLNTSRETPISIKYYDDDNKPVGAMYFNLKAANLGTATVGSTGIVVVTSAGGKDIGVMPVGALASISDSISEAENAYVNAYHPSYGYYLAFREEDQAAFTQFGGTGSAGYSDLSFHLKAEIGGTDQYWDVIGGDITLDLIWDVYAAEKLNGAKPTVKVTTKPTSGSKGTKVLVFTYTSGTGDYATYYNADPETAVTLSNNKTILASMTRDTTAKTLKSTSAAYTDVNGATATITFKANAAGIAAGKSDLTIKVSGLT